MEHKIKLHLLSYLALFDFAAQKIKLPFYTGLTKITCLFETLDLIYGSEQQDTIICSTTVNYDFLNVYLCVMHFFYLFVSFNVNLIIFAHLNLPFRNIFLLSFGFKIYKWLELLCALSTLTQNFFDSFFASLQVKYYLSFNPTFIIHFHFPNSSASNCNFQLFPEVMESCHEAKLILFIHFI